LQQHKNFLQLVKTRHSVRKFLEQPIDKAALYKCVEAARLAPSANNAQPCRFMVVDEPELKEKLAKHAFNGIYTSSRWVSQSPALIVILTHLDWISDRIGKQITGIHYYFVDAGIAGEHFILQAQELEIETCWIGWFSSKGVKKALNLPHKYRPVAIIAAGYSDTKKAVRRKRRSLSEICWFNEIK